MANSYKPLALFMLSLLDSVIPYMTTDRFHTTEKCEAHSLVSKNFCHKRQVPKFAVKERAASETQRMHDIVVSVSSIVSC